MEFNLVSTFILVTIYGATIFGVYRIIRVGIDSGIFDVKDPKVKFLIILLIILGIIFISLPILAFLISS